MQQDKNPKGVVALLTLSASNYIGIVHSDPIYAQIEPIYAPSEPIYAPSEPNLCPKWTSKIYAQSELEFMPKVSPSPKSQKLDSPM